MMIIQVATSREGNMIEGARWEVNSLSNVREGHTMQVSLAINDQSLIGYVTRQNKQEIALDRDKDKGKNGYSIILKCVVKEIRHLVDAASKNVDTMAVIIPVDRVVEGVLTYMLHPEKCDPRWVQLIRGTSNQPQP